jgi:Deoxynucleoside kinase
LWLNVLTCSSACAQEEETRNRKSMRLIERSVFCDRMVFVKAMHAAKNLSDVELEVYDSFFDPCLERTAELVPDAFVYLQTKPETCARRMAGRARSEEAAVPLQYLEQIDRFYHSWLVGGSDEPAAVRAGLAARAQLVLGSASSVMGVKRQTLLPQARSGGGGSGTLVMQNVHGSGHGSATCAPLAQPRRCSATQPGYCRSAA